VIYLFARSTFRPVNDDTSFEENTWHFDKCISDLIVKLIMTYNTCYCRHEDLIFTWKNLIVWPTNLFYLLIILLTSLRYIIDLGIMIHKCEMYIITKSPNWWRTVDEDMCRMSYSLALIARYWIKKCTISDVIKSSSTNSLPHKTNMFASYCLQIKTRWVVKWFKTVLTFKPSNLELIQRIMLFLSYQEPWKEIGVLSKIKHISVWQ
jgi:hypothetical protein